jgi:pimeloyl-ACP methyl ester carboxylesterase
VVLEDVAVVHPAAWAVVGEPCDSDASLCGNVDRVLPRQDLRWLSVDVEDLDDVTLAGESMGATVSLTASTELEDRVRRILAFNTYDYPAGVSRANRTARSTSAVHAVAATLLGFPRR